MVPFVPEALLAAGAAALAARPQASAWPAVLAPAAALVALMLDVQPGLEATPLRALELVIVAGLLAAGLLGHETAAAPRSLAPLLLSSVGLLLLTRATRVESASLAVVLAALPLAWSLRRAQQPDGDGFFAAALTGCGLVAIGLELVAWGLGDRRLDLLALPVATPDALLTAGRLTGLGLVLATLGLSHLLGAAPLAPVWTPALAKAPAPLLAWLAICAPAGAVAVLARVLDALRAPEGGLDLPGIDPGLVITATGLLGLLAARVGLRGEADLGRVVALHAGGAAGWALVALGALASPATPALDPATPLRALALLAISSLLAFSGAAALLAASDRELGGRGLERWLGAARRNAALSVALLLHLGSAGGAPPTLGFVARLHVLAAVLSVGDPLVAALLAVDVALGLAAWLRVARVVFLARPAPDPYGPAAVEPLVTTPGLTVLAVVLAVLGVALGIFPDAALTAVG